MDGVVSVRTVGHELALKAAAAAVAMGAAAGCPVVAAVVGAGGDLVAFVRASGSPSPSAKIAQDKAYSAASFRVPTPDLYAMGSGNPALRDGIVGVAAPIAPTACIQCGRAQPSHFHGQQVGHCADAAAALVNHR